MHAAQHSAAVDVLKLLQSDGPRRRGHVCTISDPCKCASKKGSKGEEKHRGGWVERGQPDVVAISAYAWFERAL